MTFYSVIAGILFIEGFKALVYALGQAQNLTLPAATVTIMIITDIMITTDAFENELKDVTHHVTCKFMDLMCFMALATMLVSVHPSALQLFDNAESRPAWWADPQVFWAASFAYWVFVIIWNELVWNEIFKAKGDWPVPLMERRTAKARYMRNSSWTPYVFRSSVFVYAFMAILAGEYETFAAIPTWANAATLAWATFYLYVQVFHRRLRADLAKVAAPRAPSGDGG